MESTLTEQDQKLTELCSYVADMVQTMREVRDRANKDRLELMNLQNNSRDWDESEVWIPAGYQFVANGITFEFYYELCKGEYSADISVKGSPSHFSVDVDFLKYLGVL